MSSTALHMAANKCYGVMLCNAAEKDDGQLRKILQEFGKIEEVQRGGVNAFVYFKEYSDARHCINALSNHAIYKAKPARPRETNTVFNRESRPLNAGNRKIRSKSEITLCRSYESSKKEYPNGEYKTFDNKSRNPTNLSREGVSLESQSLPVKKFPENPPHLISATDLWERQQNKQFLCPATVVLTNLPVSATYIDLFRLCEKFVRVPDMQIVTREIEELPRYAKIGTASWEEAEYLVNSLNNHKFMGKTLRAEIIEKIIGKK